MLHGHTWECLWAWLCVRGVPSPVWATGPLPSPVALGNSYSQQCLTSSFLIFLRARPGILRGWEWTEIPGLCLCSSSSSSLWPGSVRGSRSSLSWELCPGQEEKGAGSGWWESHPAAPGGIGAACAGAPLPSTFFFLRFLTALKRQPGILLNPIPPSLREHPWVVSEPNSSSGLPSSCSVPCKGNPLVFLSWSCSPATALPPLQFPVPALNPFIPPGVFVLESHPIPLLSH